MSLVDDYFLLYHGTSTPDNPPTVFDKTLSDEDFFELSALILSITRHQLDSFSSLLSFKEMTHKFIPQELVSNEHLYHLQHSIIYHFIEARSFSDVHLLDTPLHYLLDEKIISHDNHKKICSLFEHEKVEEPTLPEFEKNTNDFIHNKHALVTAINELKELCSDTKAFDELLTYIQDQRFSIGITGVMNAGKSSMINALMGEEILGTNVIPETANLSLIKHAPEPYAKVIYWNKAQWSRIENSALELDSMKKFVTDSKETFKGNLNEYILESSREDIIDMKKLGEYTSAAGKHSNLVKMIELGSDLHFLRENIEIVDTPGLDDVVIQREEITKEYVARCDLMIHLMNVSQSATEIDVEFIIDAVRFQNITQILIVITRVDMVKESDIQEVIAYTKRALTQKLQEYNSDAKLDFILKNIQFIALSSKMALHHKMGQADIALEQGYSLEKSGLPELEKYLHDTLYGADSQRSNLILHASKKRLFKATGQNIELLKYELSLLNKSDTELAQEIEYSKLNQAAQEKKLSALSSQIHAFKSELSKYEESLEYILKEDCKKLQGILKQRLIDETAYALEKEKSKPTLKRISTLVENSLRHGFVDLLRDYRYGLIKKMSRLKESILMNYPLNNEEFKTLSLEKHFGEAHNQITINTNIELFIQKSFKLTQENKLSQLDSALLELLSKEFDYFEKLLKEKSDALYLTLSEQFFKHLQSPLSELKNNINVQNELLEKHSALLNDASQNSESKALELHGRIKNIELITSRCSI